MSAGIKANNDGSAAIQVGGVDRVAIALDGQQSSVIPGGSTLYPEYKCRSWVNFNGTGTVAIRASGNVTSITDNGVGSYTINFTTAMPDANYSLTAAVGPASLGGECVQINTLNASSVVINVTNNNTGVLDRANVCVAIFR